MSSLRHPVSKRVPAAKRLKLQTATSSSSQHASSTSDMCSDTAEALLNFPPSYSDCCGADSGHTEVPRGIKMNIASSAVGNNACVSDNYHKEKRCSDEKLKHAHTSQTSYYSVPKPPSGLVKPVKSTWLNVFENFVQITGSMK